MKGSTVSRRWQPQFLLLMYMFACRQSDQAKKTAQSSSADSSAVDSTHIAVVNAGTTGQAGSEEIPPTADPAVLAKLENYAVDCAGKRIDLAAPVKEIADMITADSLWYGKELLSDCSGIFHRVLQAMKSRCPAYDYPDPEKYRETRDLARWYHQRGDLILVQDALASADLIKPGAVMFYGHRGINYTATNLTADTLLMRERGIEHLGVVVSIKKDAAGQLLGYELFHGQTYGKIASTTRHHERNPSRSSYMPFGNAEQQWVAVARLLNPQARQITGN